MTKRPTPNALSAVSSSATPPRGAVVPIQRQTIASMTVEALRERILRGDYPDGEPLRQDARAGEASRWGQLNWHFHAALYAPANRSFTMSVLQKLHHHSDRYFRMHVLLA